MTIDFYGIAQGFFNFLLNFINGYIVKIFTLPFEQLYEFFDTLVTDSLFTTYINAFYGVLNTYIIPSIGFFSNIVPPTTWTLFQFYIGFLIGLYGTVFTLHFSFKVLKLIKKYVPLA